MSAELIYIYDTHCPWSYVTTPLVNEIAQAFPETKLHLWHSAHFDNQTISKDLLDTVADESGLTFSAPYLKSLATAKDSTLAANFMTWVQQKNNRVTLEVLNALQTLHFEQANELVEKEDLKSIVDEFKLSPPTKVFNNNHFTKDAGIVLHDIEELREIMGTSAIPALLLVLDEQLILFNHNLYLQTPKAIIDAIQIELNK
jgi:putative protein-disulfide isomerase